MINTKRTNRRCSFTYTFCTIPVWLLALFIVVVDADSIVSPFPIPSDPTNN